MPSVSSNVLAEVTPQLSPVSALDISVILISSFATTQPIQKNKTPKNKKTKQKSWNKNYENTENNSTRSHLKKLCSNIFT